MSTVFPLPVLPSSEKSYNVVNGTAYDTRTPETVVRILEQCRANRTRIQLHYGDTEILAGRDWHEENDTTGRVSRSTGTIKIPILVHNARSTGGGAILDHCIVGIRTTGKNGRWLYKHPQYRAKMFEVHAVDCSRGYVCEVRADGEPVARFKTSQAAFRYISKVSGPS